MASKKRKKITADQVEQLKDDQGFDRKLARAIVPLGHRRRHIIDHDVLGGDAVKAIRDSIDPHFTVFVANGANKIPNAIRKYKQRRKQGRFSPRPELDKLLRTFLDKAFTELRQKKPNKSDLRRVIRKAKELIVTIIRRDPRLAEFVT